MKSQLWETNLQLWKPVTYEQLQLWETKMQLWETKSQLAFDFFFRSTLGAIIHGGALFVFQLINYMALFMVLLYFHVTDHKHYLSKCHD